MTLERWLPWLVAAALAAGGAWWWSATEWREVTETLPLRGEAASNRWYAVEQLAKRLGATTQVREQLDAMPPPAATLVISSSHWPLFPGRDAALRRWVEDGGHLVLPAYQLAGSDGDAALAWIPLQQAHDTKDVEAVQALRKAKGPGNEGPLCRDYRERATLAPAYERMRRFSICNHAGSWIKSSRPLTWAVDSPAGPYVATLALGRGSITVLADTDPLRNRTLTQGDNGLITAAALRLTPGRLVWLVAEERRSPLLAWLWQHGAVALCLGLLALALLLWRQGTRFGPLRAAAPAARRAVTGQVRGTAIFLAQRGGEPLLAAARRALSEAAAARLNGFAGLNGAGRAALVARRTGLDAQALAAAWQPSNTSPAALPRGRLIVTLQLLETARRRLAGTELSTSTPHQDLPHADSR